MCDWDAEEYAEYLLWAEAEKARAEGRARAVVGGAPRTVTAVSQLPPETVVA